MYLPMLLIKRLLNFYMRELTFVFHNTTGIRIVGANLF